jgi:hypothetical protein
MKIPDEGVKLHVQPSVQPQQRAGRTEAPKSIVKKDTAPRMIALE